MNPPAVLPNLSDKLYAAGSLFNGSDGVRFSLTNRLADVLVTRFSRFAIDDQPVPLDLVTLASATGESQNAAQISPTRALAFRRQQTAQVRAADLCLGKGAHRIELELETSAFGPIVLEIEDVVRDDAVRPTGPVPPGKVDERPARTSVPCNKEENCTTEIIRQRLRFAEEHSGVVLRHIAHYSFDPRLTRGNIENFVGVAQVPLALVGPLLVNGEDAKGSFLVPMATSEGTMVASYNRGIKVLNLAGGVKCTVVGDGMQRAPVFVFESAREALHFKQWLTEHLDEIRRVAESTSRVARLIDIEVYLVGKMAYLRFNFSTGDAAGQNMVSRATLTACMWILEQVRDVHRFYLEANLATDKKTSHLNVLRTRGKRVVAEATIPRDILVQHLRVEPETICDHGALATLGALLSGANNNGAQSPNGIAAMFIATGQDVANLAESSAAIGHAEVTAARDLYVSITLPSLIVATHGGGTGLPTQRECLEILGCSGHGKVNRFAEIVAGVALAGELSLGAAISSNDWVASHEKYGRNRE